MATTRPESRAREIFSTMDYGPAPESHACALVRACPPALPSASPVPSPQAPLGTRTPVIPRGSSATPPLSAHVIPACP